MREGQSRCVDQQSCAHIQYYSAQFLPRFSTMSSYPELY